MCLNFQKIRVAMKGCHLILIAFQLINASIAKEKRQFFGGGFGCGSTLQTIGNYCYQPVQDGTVVCRGKSYGIRI